MMQKNYLQKILLSTIAGFCLLSGINQSAHAQSEVYAAISYSPSTKIYSSGIENSKSAVIDAALNNCIHDSSANDCKVLISFKNAWGALAIDSNGDYGTGKSTEKELAENQALKSCKSHGNTDCEVVFVLEAK